MRWIYIILILAYVALTPWTRTGWESRVIPADLVSVILILLAFFEMLRSPLILPVPFKVFLPLLAVFFVSGLLALYPERATLEIVVTLFGYLGAIAMLTLAATLTEAELRILSRGYVLVIGLTALVFLLDFLLFPGTIGRVGGGLTGSMRNTGQAGSFMGMHLAVFTALLLSGMVPAKPSVVLSVIAVILALVFTLKRASWIGFGSGALLLTLMMLFSTSVRDKKIGVIVISLSALLALVGSSVFFWALDNVQGMSWRFGYKFSADAVDGFVEGFLQENIDGTLSAIDENALLGAGLGNVAGVHTAHYEIHSTYLAIFATSGVFGVVAYLIFVAGLLWYVWSIGRDHIMNSYAAFNYYLLPLLLGLFVSWAYTYHIRKREFWILMMFVGIAGVTHRRLKRQRTQAR